MSKINHARPHALLVCPDGFFKVIDWPAESAQNLRTLYAEIECDRVDAVDITRTLTMWVDDEGAIVSNPSENAFAGLLIYRYATPPQPYFGNVIFTGGVDAEGNTLGLTDDQTLELVGHVLTVHAIAEQNTL
ncbi:DUF3846 domain-containing protein [Streptomyces hydrogenans]|uniref:DUF3846 domain-containing protein n=1 Tax=Streptomyces hydrogenans TaxID=1873719 RepID=UPI0035DE225B